MAADIRLRHSAVYRPLARAVLPGAWAFAIFAIAAATDVACSSVASASIREFTPAAASQPDRLSGTAVADYYMHNPRGANDRLQPAAASPRTKKPKKKRKPAASDIGR